MLLARCRGATTAGCSRCNSLSSNEIEVSIAAFDSRRLHFVTRCQRVTRRVKTVAAARVFAFIGLISGAQSAAQSRAGGFFTGAKAGRSPPCLSLAGRVAQGGTSENPPALGIGPRASSRAVDTVDVACSTVYVFLCIL